MTLTILLADNIQAFVDVRANFLESAGFRTIRAYSLADAQRLMREAYFHLAILDIRLVDDGDTNDISGIKLAKDPQFRNIPKIILTGYPDFQTVSEIFSLSLSEMPPFVNYLLKGPARRRW